MRLAEQLGLLDTAVCEAPSEHEALQKGHLIETGRAIADLRRQVENDLELGNTPRGRLAAGARMLDHSLAGIPVGRRVTAILQSMAKACPADASAVREYVERYGPPFPLLVSFHATRQWSERVSELGPPRTSGEAETRLAAEAVGARLGISATEVVGHLDPSVVAAYRRGTTLEGTMAKAGAGAGLSREEHRFLVYLNRVGQEATR